MFKLSHKVSIIRNLIISVASILVVAIGIFIINKITAVNAVTPEGTPVEITADRDYHYDDDNATNHYLIDRFGQNVEGFCAQPSLGNPVGSSTAIQLSNSDNTYNIIKLAIYIFQNNNSYANAARNDVYAPWLNEESLYPWVHATIGALYANDYVNISEGNVINIQNAISKLQNYINSDSDVWTIAKNYQLFMAPGRDSSIQDVVWIESRYTLGTINVQKCDNATQSCTAQGGASLGGITFTVYNNSGTRIFNPATGSFYNNGAVVATGTTNASGAVSFNNLLADNVTYLVKETATNPSYGMTAPEQTVLLNGEGSVKNLQFYNDPSLGSITVNKTNSVTGGCSDVGDATLSGTWFQLINNNNSPVQGADKGEEISRKQIDGSCHAVFSGLPYGSYIVKEIIVGTGYNINTAEQTVTIPTGGQVNITVNFSNTPIYGDITVYKKDSSTQSGTTVGDATFNGTQFQLINNSTSRIYYNGAYKNSGDVVDTKTLENGATSVKFEGLPFGKYIVKEVASGAGYNAVITPQNLTITANGLHPTATFTNSAVLGDITINKQDDHTGNCTTVGDTSFNDTTFRIINRSAKPVYYNNQAYAVDAVIDSKTLTNGACNVKFENLPYGRYDVEETQAGNGYNLNTEVKRVTIPTNSSIHVSAAYTNTPIYGDITVNKKDSSTQSGTTVGDATFNGTQFQLINKSTNGIYYNGSYKASGEVIDTKTLTNGATSVKFDGLPVGRYQVKEVAVGTGYNVVVTPQDLSITTNSLHPTATFTNSAILGDITINKQDDHTGTCTTVGNASFNNTTFRIINRSANPIYYNNQPVAVGAVIDSKTLTNGACNVKFENLPYGRYDVEETSAGNGYNLNTEVKRVTIPTDGNIHTSTTYVNTPVYGDLTIYKEDAETKECVAVKHLSFIGISYEIINRSKNPVYYDGHFVAVGAVIATRTFTEDPCNGGLTVGPLPYGTYEIKETSVSEGYVLNTTPNTEEIDDNELHPKSTFVNQAIRGDVTFVKTDPTNNRPMSDVVFTISRINDDDVLEETHILVTDENGVIDTRSSFNLHSYMTNRYDALYEEPDPLQYSGFGTWYGYDNLDRPLPVNDSLPALPYGRYVIQELKCGANLFCYGVINEKATITINSHHQVVDLGDWDNNCAKLSMDTEAVDAEDEDHFVEIKTDKPSAKIIDKIDFCIKPKFKVTIKGILMDKQTGEPLLINGQTIENSVDVMLEEGEECGSTEMVFDIPDITALGGHELVTFQTMWYKDEILLKHHDIDDESETVEIISLSTYAMNKDTNDKFLPYDQQTVVRDIVKYCVKPGLEYTIKGIVMNKDTQAPLLINNETVEQEVTFTPEQACGELEMFYPIDTTGLAGAKLIVFESLYRDDELILEHKDFNNPDESFEVEIPAPDTGVFTGSEQSGSAVNIALVIFVVSTAGVTVYGVSRVCARKSFLKRK